jgi:ribonuclease VapC
MFVDASVLVAIAAAEPDGQTLAARLEGATRPITSPVAVVEAVMSLGRKKRISPQTARFEVISLLARAQVSILPIDSSTGDLAIDAHARYGKGSDHPARLNLGDCFAYAMAKQHGVPLLFKGDDFSKTDLA